MRVNLRNAQPRTVPCREARHGHLRPRRTLCRHWLPPSDSLRCAYRSSMRSMPLRMKRDGSVFFREHDRHHPRDRLRRSGVRLLPLLSW